jgi:NTE family protein
LALKALDEMGISLVAIAGTFMGAIVGGAYAAGIKGRAHSEPSIASLKQSLRRDERAIASAAGWFADLVLRDRANPVLRAPEICLDVFWLSGILTCFEDLAIKSPLSSQPFS